jgi:hypothetical protein
MEEFVTAIERIGFPIAMIIFGAWYFLLPLRDAALRFVGTLEKLLVQAGQDISTLKGATANIIQKFDVTTETVTDTNKKVTEFIAPKKEGKE